MHHEDHAEIEDLGIAPNWLGSITFKTSGTMHLSTSTQQIA
jgi:hypothetical protein